MNAGISRGVLNASSMLNGCWLSSAVSGGGGLDGGLKAGCRTAAVVGTPSERGTAESHAEGSFVAVVAWPLVNEVVAIGGLDVGADPKSKASSKDCLKIGFGLSSVIASGVIGLPPNAASSSAVPAGRLASSSAGNRAGENGESSKVLGDLEAGELRPFFADGGGGSAEKGVAGGTGSFNPKASSKVALKAGAVGCLGGCVLVSCSVDVSATGVDVNDGS